MGPMVFPPSIYHEHMFQILAQSIEAIQSYWSASAGYRNLGINGGEGKWPKMSPNVLNQLYSESWVSLRLSSSI